jgi:hypothetical protein
VAFLDHQRPWWYNYTNSDGIQEKNMRNAMERPVTNAEGSRKLKRFAKLLIVIIGMCGLIPTLTFAGFPAGQWTMTSYSEVGLESWTHGICIQEGGTWYSDTYRGWSGKWHRRVNDIHLQGNYSNGAGNTAFELNVINGSLLTGYLQHWRDDNLVLLNDFSRVKLIYQKSLCNPSK